MKVMINHVIEKTFGVHKRNGAFVSCICFFFAVAILLPMAALCGSDRLTDSDEYKAQDFHKGIIADYSDMVKGDGIDWVWAAPAEKLTNYKIRVGSITNKSDSHSKALLESVKSKFERSFADMDFAGTNGTLTAELCITEVQEYARGKRWIPFAGRHLAQAGMGIEIILRDQNNRMVAKLRHFDHHGRDVRLAEKEVTAHMVSYISRH
jgi:hypothetical protein